MDLMLCSRVANAKAFSIASRCKIVFATHRKILGFAIEAFALVDVFWLFSQGRK